MRLRVLSYYSWLPVILLDVTQHSPDMEEQENYGTRIEKPDAACYGTREFLSVTQEGSS